MKSLSPPPRHRPISKVDRVLGQGALEASIALEKERKVLQEAFDNVVGMNSPGASLPPSRLGHKASASSPSPAYLASPSRIGGSPITPSLNHSRSNTSSFLSRSDSHQSLADSVHTSTRLLPADHPCSPETIAKSQALTKALPLLPPSPVRGVSNSPTRDISSRHDQSPEQRRAALRSMRALEKRLGEPLREDEAGRWIVGPAMDPGKRHSDASDIPHTPVFSSPSADGPVRDNGIQWTGTGLAKKTKAAFGLDKGKDKDVNREKATRDITSPVSPDFTDYDSLDEDTRKHHQRRRQITKLNKLLGTVITPSQLAQQALYSSAIRRAPLTDPPLADELSWLDLDEAGRASSYSPSPTKESGGSWTKKIRQTIGKRANTLKEAKAHSVPTPTHSPSSPRQDIHSYSPVSSIHSSPVNLLAHGQAVSRKGKSSDQSFSGYPANDMYPYITVPINEQGDSRNVTLDSESSHKIEGPRKTPSTISNSIQGLLYLLDNDREELERIVDELDNDDPAQSPTLPTRSISTSARQIGVPKPDLALDLVFPDPHSKEARRKRTGKLSHFFGETNVNFDVGNTDHPVLPPNYRLHHSVYRSKSKARRETLDGMLGEMWRAIQMERQRGEVDRNEVDKVGDLIRMFKKRRDRMEGDWERIQ